MPYLVFLAVLVTLMIVVALILVLNRKDSIELKKDVAENARLYKEAQDKKAKENADIPSSMIFDVPKGNIDEYYRIYGECGLPTSDFVKRYKFWAQVIKMIPEMELEPKIVGWLKDSNHTVWYECNNDSLMKPYVIVYFGKRNQWGE